MGVNSDTRGRALFFISARGVVPVGFWRRVMNFWGAGLALEGETKEASWEPKERSSALIELRVWASERGVWMAKCPAVAMVVDNLF